MNFRILINEFFKRLKFSYFQYRSLSAKRRKTRKISKQILVNDFIHFRFQNLPPNVGYAI